MNLDGQTAVVTGAGQGIGRAIAERLAREGARLALFDINAETVRETAELIERDGATAQAYTVDCTDSQMVNDAVEQVVSQLGSIRILVNNIGWAEASFFEEEDPAYWDKVLAINLKAPFNVAHAVLNVMKQEPGGHIQKVRIPLGVIGMVYESRPNVTVDAAGLCLKSGNAIILRGGSEAIHSNTVLGDILRTVCKGEELDPNIIQVIPTTNRDAMKILVEQTQYIDLMIPRGGEGLMQWMSDNSRVPVIKHDKGVCHLYIDKAADPVMAEEIALNAKVQRPGVCNALETLLVHEALVDRVLPSLIKKYQDAGVELRGDDRTQQLAPGIKAATDSDWDAEYLDLILAIRIVPSVEAAMDHIAKHGSLHTEVIVSEDKATADRFLHQVDASMVGWNASTRFNDGGQLGLGAEIGISTTKMHAFGPMGLEELTTTKYVVMGTGQIRT